MSAPKREPAGMELVGRIYDAALDPGLWPLVLEGLAQGVGATVVNLVFQNFNERRVDFISSYGWNAAHVSDYEEMLARDNPILDSILEKHDTVYRSGDLVDEHRAAESDYFKIGLKPNNLHFIAGVVAFRDDARIAQFECLRSKKRGAFKAADLKFLGRFQPHLSRALQLNQKFWDAFTRHTAAEQVLDNLELGVILLDEAGIAVYQNQYATEVTREQSVLALVGGRVVPVSAADKELVAEGIKEAVRTGLGKGMYAGGIFKLYIDPERPLFLQITPLRSERNDLGFSNSRVCAAIFLHWPEKTQPLPLQALKDQFGLSNAEAAIVQELDRGMTLDEVASAVHISKHTARDHLKSIFMKTGTRRQTELARLLLCSPTSFLRESEMLGPSVGGPLDRRREAKRHQAARPSAG